MAGDIHGNNSQTNTIGQTRGRNTALYDCTLCKENINKTVFRAHDVETALKI